MAERTLAALRVDDVPVAAYRDGNGLDPALSPRPYLHPVRTLAGTPVTDAGPADHPWHLGVSVALQDVDGWNFWGGPTYVRGEGYVWRDDHGRVEHAGFARRDDSGFIERLRWVTPTDEVLLSEERRLRARPVRDGWELEIGTTLTNATDRDVRLGSPGTNGREGAGYGGFFWRLPHTQAPQVRTAADTGEQSVHGSRAPWLAWADLAAEFTLVFTRSDGVTPADPWFVRIADYPGVGVQVAARDPLTLSAGDRVTRRLHVLVADGVLPRRTVLDWADAAAEEPARDSQHSGG
jgi:Family of unknown function (DUF6807)